MEKIKVGIIGCGAIGAELALFCATKLKDKTKLTALFDIDKEKINALSRKIKIDAGVSSITELIKKSDFVIEAASKEVSADVAERAVLNKKEVLIMSVGGLIGREDIIKRAEKENTKIYLPSGALCGIDGLKAAKITEVKSVTLTTRKPPKGLEGAPYIAEKGIDLKSIKGEKIIFEGSAEEAVKGFPKNINVSAILSLAGIGPKKTKVRIITSPDYTENIHEVEIVGRAGKITTRCENIPSPTNPKTSFLAVLSAQAALKQITGAVRVGT